MSINDLLDSEFLLPSMAIVFLFIVLIGVPIGIASTKKATKEIYGEDSDFSAKEQCFAVLIARRTAAHPLSPAVTVNTAVFEKEDGSRIELAIKDSEQFSLMVEGDKGLLYYQGKRFIDFERSSFHET